MQIRAMYMEALGKLPSANKHLTLMLLYCQKW